MARWLGIPYDVLKAEGWVSPKTGEHIPFKSLTDKALLCLFRDRNTYFHKQWGRHDDKQSVLADILGVSRWTVNSFLSVLVEEGVVVCKKKGNYQNDYGKMIPPRVYYEGESGVVYKDVFGEEVCKRMDDVNDWDDANNWDELPW